MAKAQLAAIAHSDLERKIRMSQGRRGTFLTQSPSRTLSPEVAGGAKTLLGQ
jgi:hypothetical protein